MHIQRFEEKLNSLNNIRLLDKGSHRAAIITAAFNDTSLESVVKHLDSNKVYFSIAQKSSALIDFNKKNVEWAIRFSPHYFNTTEEVDALSEILSNI